MTMSRNADPARILAVLGGDRNRELLVDWLEDAGWRVDVSTTMTDGDWDLCVVDDRGLAENRDRLRARKADAAPVSLPAVLVTRDPADVSDLPVDDQIAIPTRQRFLRRRIETLLQTREFSVRLRRSRERYSRLVECLPEALFIVADGRIEYANPAAADLVGAAATDEILGRSVERYLSAEDRSIDALLAGTTEAGTAGSVGFEAVEIDASGGERRLCELAAVRVVYDGEPATQVLVRDLTDRRERETRLRLYERALDEAVQGVTIADADQPDMPIVYANRSFERVTGYDIAEVLGRNCRFLQGPETDPDTVDRIRAGIENDEPVSVEIRNYRKDGTPFWNALDVAPVRDEDGDVTHYVGLQRDVTERKERERALERYETVVRTAADAIYVLDADGEIVEVNDAMTKLTGRSRDALLGAKLDAFLDPPDASACRIASGSSVTERTVEVPVLTLTGKRRSCEVTVAPLPGDAFDGTVGIVRDVSERRRKQQQLSVLDRVLRHNLRNKMTVLCGRAEMIRQASSLDRAREHAREIDEVATNLLSLSETARSIQTVIADETSGTVRVDLSRVVEDVVATVRDRYPNATVTADVPDDAAVRAHESIDVAVKELVENAIVHNDGDDPRVDVSIAVDDAEATLTVADDGPGIPPTERAVLSADAESPLEHTDRLGLWLVRWTLNLSDSEFTFDCNDPRGTVVTVRFRTT